VAAVGRLLLAEAMRGGFRVARPGGDLARLWSDAAGSGVGCGVESVFVICGEANALPVDGPASSDILLSAGEEGQSVSAGIACDLGCAVRCVHRGNESVESENRPLSEGGVGRSTIARRSRRGVCPPLPIQRTRGAPKFLCSVVFGGRRDKKKGTGVRCKMKKKWTIIAKGWTRDAADFL
jgi:hypothetical protein